MRRLLILILISLSAYSTIFGQLMGSELNYAKDSNEIITITYRLFLKCDGSNTTAPSFKSYLFSTSSKSSKILLKPTYVGTRNQLILCDTFVSSCENSTLGIADIKEFYYEVKVNPSDSNFNILSNDCAWIVDLKIGLRDSSITTVEPGFAHYNFCKFNKCIMGINHSPQFTFNLTETPCKNRQFQNFSLDAIDFEGNSRMNTFGKALYDFDSTVSYKSGYDFNYPVTGYFIKSLPRTYSNCYANPIIGVCLDEDYLSYMQFNCNEKSLVVIESIEYIQNPDLTFTQIGLIRRDFSLNSDINNNIDNYKPTVSYHLQKGYIGDTFNFKIESHDVLAINQTSGDSVKITWPNMIQNATYQVLNEETKTPTLMITWIPTLSDTLQNPHLIDIELYDNNCPIRGYNRYQIPVYAFIKPTITRKIKHLSCGLYEITFEGSSGSQLWSVSTSIKQITKTGIHLPDPNYYFYSTNSGNSTKRCDTISFNASGVYQAITSIRMINGDWFYLVDTIWTVQVTEISFQPTGFLCHYEKVKLDYLVKSFHHPIKYRWMISNDSNWYNDSNIWYHPAINNEQLITLTLAIADSLGCTVTKSNLYITIGILPKLELGNDFANCKIDTVLEAQDFATFEWNTGDTTNKLAVQTSGLYSIKVIDQFGCKQYDSITIKKYLTQKPTLVRIDTILSSSSQGIHVWYFEKTLLDSSKKNFVDLKEYGIYKCVLWENNCRSDTSFFIYSQNADINKMSDRLFT